jgi:hypothetical protein
MEDFEEVKKVVSNKQFYEPIGADPLPHEVVDLNKMMEETPKLAPIFVRVDKYKEILSHIQDLKATIKDIESALAARKNIHKINAESDELMEKAVQKFAASTNLFGKEFTTPRGAEQFANGPAEQSDMVDSTISKISDEVVKLKLELEKIKL